MTLQVFFGGSCHEFQQEDFGERCPLFNRHMEFFTSEQAPGQELSAWISTLKELSDESEIENMSLQEIIIFRILEGCKNLKFRSELTKL